MNIAKSIACGVALLAVGGGCSSNSNNGPLGNIDSLVILQRPARLDAGDIFQYTSYVPTARLTKLSPPTAAGTQTTICCTQDPAFANVDISGYDISFDATQIVFAGKLDSGTPYGLFMLNLGDGTITQLATDPNHGFTSPIFLPGDKILYMSNAVVEPGAPQHQDEYERGTTTQVGIMNIDGSNNQLGPRNLSHRTMPSLASDGRVIFTQWDHLGPMNAGHLMFMHPDMTTLREAFGKEGTAASNSTVHAVEISPGRFVAIATSRDRTFNSGALIDVRLGYPYTTSSGDIAADNAMSEAHASYVNLSDNVPVDNTPSSNTVGRFYDAYPLNAHEHPDLLVSWADGPVETEVNAAANVPPNFNIYLYTTSDQQRHPVLSDPTMWNIFAKPLQARTAPPVIAGDIDGSLNGQVLMGSMNVYTSTLHTFQPGSVFGVRVMEGYSSEEGFPRMFGTSMFEGHAALGVARVAGDGSWLATVPANVPIHLQAVDNFGMSLFNEPVWFSGRANESRVCGGCHEDRAATTVINPGITQAAAIGPTGAMGLVPRSGRVSVLTDLADANLVSPTGDQNATAASLSKIVSIGWNNSLQPTFDAKCVSCHGDTNTAGIPGYQVIDPTTGAVVFQWTFNLSGKKVTIDYGMGMVETFSASYLSMAGLDMEAIGRNMLMVTGNYKVYLNPTDAAGSLGIQKVNPTQLFPQPNTAVRAFSTQPHSATTGNYGGAGELTPAEFYKLILAADMGALYYSRDNNPGNGQYQ